MKDQLTTAKCSKSTTAASKRTLTPLGATPTCHGDIPVGGAGANCGGG